MPQCSKYLAANAKAPKTPFPILPSIPIVKHEMQRRVATPYQPAPPSLWFSPTSREAGDGSLTGIARVRRGISDLPVDGGCHDLVVVLGSAAGRLATAWSWLATSKWLATSRMCRGIRGYAARRSCGLPITGSVWRTRRSENDHQIAAPVIKRQVRNPAENASNAGKKSIACLPCWSAKTIVRAAPVGKELRHVFAFRA